ncbi:MAG: alkaline phosphatase family protein [Xanthomonadaceae bacterium]|nr:alkaline phosphatase family protein [Xanthomonadaceae bacterium]
MPADSNLRALAAILAACSTRRTALLALLVLVVQLSACAAPQRDRSPTPASRHVILVSIDGLPASMLGNGTLPTLDALSGEGVHARWLTPSYPTLTFPNHYTLVTGLRPDRHGIVHNNMRDADLGVFLSKQDSAKDGRWWGGEPIWVTLQRQGGIAATMFWPGSEAEIAGQRPAHYVPFDKSLAPDARVDQVLDWLDLPTDARPRLLTLYFDQYDATAHEHGAAAPQSLSALHRIDRALARLRAGLRARGLGDGTDLIVLSDHGMADVPSTRMRLLDERLDGSAYDIVWWGLFTGLQPKPGREAEVERAFVGRHDVYECWRKQDLPRQWRYGTHARIPPIVCQSDVGWRVQGRRNPVWPNPLKGEHGFAPEAPEMRAVFVAAGPSFKRGVTLPAFDNVDVYPLLAKLLGVEPAPNDGTLESTRPALR